MSASAYPSNLAHLQGALLTLNLRLHRQVLRWRATHHPDATPDELLGLCISDQDLDLVLDGLYAASAPDEADAIDRAPLATLNALLQDALHRHQAREQAALAAGVELRLCQLAQRFDLNGFEQQVIVLALAVELDRRYERILGYLNDDVSRRYPTVAIALDLFCHQGQQRLQLQPSLGETGHLRSQGLIHLSQEPGGLPPTLLSRGVKLADRIVAYLLGHDALEPALEPLLEIAPPSPLPLLLEPAVQHQLQALTHYLTQAIAPHPLLVLPGPDGQLQRAVAAHLADHLGRSLLVVDATALERQPQPEELLHQVRREVRLRQAMLAIHPIPAQPSEALLTLLHGLLRQPSAAPVVLMPPPSWPASGPLASLLQLHLPLPAPSLAVRQQLWATCLNGQGGTTDWAELADRFRLTRDQMARAMQEATLRTTIFGEGDRPSEAELWASCRAQSRTALHELADRVESPYHWEDLVLPVAIKTQLQSLENWVRYRPVVYGEWGFAERLSGHGLAVLFSGPSGTGKTMAAGILARNLALDLYRIDLSTVVSKYIGETEKNLSRIFSDAESANAILFFDEADALFGKRSEVKDAHDRYANIEVSYLLQRMEAYDGMAILATNFKQNLDHAFARRLRFTIEFPFPQASDRERIWRQLLPAVVPQADDIDLSYLARQFSLSGGNIKNCVLTAAFSAAADRTALSMRHLIQAVVRELEKLEQPIVSSDFGIYRDWIRTTPSTARGTP